MDELRYPTHLAFMQGFEEGRDAHVADLVVPHHFVLLVLGVAGDAEAVLVDCGRRSGRVDDTRWEGGGNLQSSAFFPVFA